MITSASVGKRIWDEFAVHLPSSRKKRQKKLSAAVGERVALEKPIHYFSPFIPAHREAAYAIYKDLQTLAAGATDELAGISLVLDRIMELRVTEHPDLLEYVLEIFLLHDVRHYQFQMPSILLREPEMAYSPAPVPPGYAPGNPDETWLNWFREDPLLNEHHAHWHSIYDYTGHKDRQGEMFFYMHRQMLARYDAERRAAGLPAVLAYDDFSKPIAVAYHRNVGNVVIAQPREANAPVNPANAIKQLSKLKTIREDIESGKYDPALPGNMQAEINGITLLGTILDGSNTDHAGSPYHDYHGDGHAFIEAVKAGAMGSFKTSAMDPVFWEWHKGIDNIYERLIQRLPRHGQFLDAPSVKIKKAVDAQGKPYSSDIILCNKADIENFSKEHGTAIGQSAFGNNAWIKDFEARAYTYVNASGAYRKITTTDTLHTMMKTGSIRYFEDGEPKTLPYTYLNHEPFCYFIRIENTSGMHLSVTVRVFMVPIDNEEKTSSWIEMDKFYTELPPYFRTVLFRDDEELSVIRKPAKLEPAEYDMKFDENKTQTNDIKCDCGWPYHLLLPRGLSGGKGMSFHFLVMITDGSIDLMEEKPNCGSLSFCGVRSKKYPDKRPMGYPFNHNFSAGNSGGIIDAIRTNPHMASRQIFILHKEN